MPIGATAADICRSSPGPRTRGSLTTRSPRAADRHGILGR
jgi:hypothetical protein